MFTVTENNRLVASLDDNAIKQIIFALYGNIVITDILMNTVKDTLDYLGNNEKNVLMCKYGANRKMSFREIGQIFGLTAERMRTLRDRAMSKIRRRVRTENIRILTKDILGDIEMKPTECFADRTAEYYYKLGYKQALKDIKEYVK